MSQTCVYRWWDSHPPGQNVKAGILKQLTQDYWDKKTTPPAATKDERMEWYITHLLPKELRAAEGRVISSDPGWLLPRPATTSKAAEQRYALAFRRCHTLALLVGYSPEPLLQAISVYQPERLVLLLNEDSQGARWQDRGNELRRWILAYLAPQLSPPQADIDTALIHSFDTDRPCTEPPARLTADAIVYEPVTSQPDSVFRALNNTVLADQQAGRDVVVDITGGKKSMSAGAFVFAAYTGVPISYVDFDEYDPERRLPFGYTCQIDALANPYQRFALRNWEQVRHLYDNGHYRAAARTLSGILEGMAALSDQEQQSSPAAGLANTASASWGDHLAAARKLQVALDFYAAVDDGDYNAAWRMLSKVAPILTPDLVPPSVRSLGEDWPPHIRPTAHTAAAEAKPTPRAEGRDKSAADPGTAALAADLANKHSQQQAAMLVDNVRLLAYVQDELDRIERLIAANEDNRSALLRAAGLDELLLKARLVRLWDLDWLFIKDHFWCTPSGLSDPSLQACLREVLVRHNGTERMRSTLQRRSNEDLKLTYYKSGTRPSYWATRRGRATEQKVYVEYEGSRNATAPVLQAYWDKASVGLGVGVLKDLRDQAIHSTLSVPPAVACAALRLAEANYREFVDNGWAALRGPVPAVGPRTLDWAKLTEICGVTFLPFTKNAEEDA